MTKDERIAELEREVEELKKQHKVDALYIDDQHREIIRLENEVAKYNEYFKCFACESFEEFQEFIGTFMLTPHEEQTYIRELENKVKHLRHEICEKIRNWCNKNKIDYYKESKTPYIIKRVVDITKLEKILNKIERGEK